MRLKHSAHVDFFKEPDLFSGCLLKRRVLNSLEFHFNYFVICLILINNVIQILSSDFAQGLL